MRDIYGDKIFTVMPNETVKRDGFQIRLEDTCPIKRAQRDWFRNQQQPQPIVKAKSFAQLKEIRR